MKLYKKLEELKYTLKKLGKVAIAYSGGVDSNFLLNVANEVLGKDVIAITINAMMHSSREIEESRKFANSMGVKHIVADIKTNYPNEFINNNNDRCYHCKIMIFNKIKKIAMENNIKYVLDGTNFSDLGDYRPGLKALSELEIVSPLKDCCFSKDDIRNISKEMNLCTYDKAAFACLATRIPYGTQIKDKLLRKIECSENYLADIGFHQYRVRVYDDIARIEVGKDEISKFFTNELFEKTNTKLKELGFNHVTLDMGGYVMGGMNKDVI